jgi:hypothetical protein
MLEHEIGARQTGISAARESRADKVLRGLRHFAHNGIVCELPSMLARWLGISVDTVQRGIRDLLIDGRIERTPMRTGKATAYRLVGSPQPDVASPHESSPAAPIGAVGPLRGLPPAPQTDRRNDFGGSPMAAEDREWMQSNWSEDRFEWTEYLAALEWIASTSLEAPLGIEGLDHVERGECDDCKQPAGVRRQFGEFALCVPCIGRRLAAGLKLASDVARAVPNERDRLERNITAPVRVEWRST